MTSIVWLLNIMAILSGYFVELDLNLPIPDLIFELSLILYVHMYINPELYIFEGLTSDEVNYFALMCEPIDFDSGAMVMREGSESDGRAFFIESGEAEVIQNGKVVTTLKTGDIFGEIALITNDARSASIRAKS